MGINFHSIWVVESRDVPLRLKMIFQLHHFLWWICTLRAFLAIYFAQILNSLHKFILWRCTFAIITVFSVAFLQGPLLHEWQLTIRANTCGRVLRVLALPLEAFLHPGGVHLLLRLEKLLDVDQLQVQFIIHELEYLLMALRSTIIQEALIVYASVFEYILLGDAGDIESSQERIECICSWRRKRLVGY